MKEIDTYLYEGDTHSSKTEALPRKNCFRTNRSLGEGVSRRECPPKSFTFPGSDPKEREVATGYKCRD